MQAHLDEMTGNHDTSEHADYAAEKDKIGYENGTERNDDGSETNKKVAGATDTVTRPSELRQTVNEVENESKERRRQGCSNRFAILCSLTEQWQEEVEHQAEAVAAGVEPTGETEILDIRDEAWKYKYQVRDRQYKMEWSWIIGGVATR
jgi:hypothetical protein